MSELINNSTKRKELLKHMILQLHEGAAPEEVRGRLASLMQKIPYGEVVEVEQQLIHEGLPEEEVLKLCDIHTEALEGQIDLSGAQLIPPGHPVDTFRKENDELNKVADMLEKLYQKAEDGNIDDIRDFILQLRGNFNNLMDVEKHYQRKENLLFPYLEKHGITGPPKVMWGKHDEIRGKLKAALEALDSPGELSIEEIRTMVELVLKPASDGVADMTYKENEILLPMSMDKLTDVEWYEVYRQTDEYGFCLYDPQTEWKPQGIEFPEEESDDDEKIKFPSGSFSKEELIAVFKTLPVDVTFVDKNDKVKFFSQKEDRIFARSRAILNRDVHLCHPPHSVDKVNRILEDFKSGKQNRARFWINLHGKFIHIEYYAIRNDDGEYLGTLEVTQDCTSIRQLEGEQRLLNYDSGNNNGN